MSQKREFNNPFEDYSKPNTVIDSNTGQLKTEICDYIKENVKILLQSLEKNLKKTDLSDYTVYTGTSGIGFLYYHLGSSSVFVNKEDTEMLLNKSLSCMEKIVSHLRKREYSFVLGDSGPLAIAAVLYHKMGKTNDALKLVNDIHSMVISVCNINSDIPDEILYGRSGFLYALLFVRKHINDSRQIISNDDLRNVIEAIIKSGQRTAERERRSSLPLMYYWYGEAYVGAAHGIMGIMTMLLQAKELLKSDELNMLIKPTIDFILSLRLPSGNYPAVIGERSDTLIHWCHGAPGAVHLFALSYQTFGDMKYLNAANECSDLIWKRGLIKKGYGICHGAAGNAYAFLALYRITNEEKHLYRAIKFAEWCFDYGKHGCRVADHPYSLFEGLSGTLCFLADLLKPKESTFPAFEISLALND